jgi:hypothetical protein
VVGVLVVAVLLVAGLSGFVGPGRRRAGELVAEFVELPRPARRAVVRAVERGSLPAGPPLVRAAALARARRVHADWWTPAVLALAAAGEAALAVSTRTPAYRWVAWPAVGLFVVLLVLQLRRRRLAGRVLRAGRVLEAAR